MKTPIENISELQFDLSVDSVQWERAASFDYFGPDDQVFTFDTKTNEIRFGDGVHGKMPPAGSKVQAVYRYGGGAAGNVDNGPTIALTWTSTSFRKNEVIGAIIEPRPDGTIFRICRESEVPHRWKFGEILFRRIKRWALRLTCKHLN